MTKELIEKICKPSTPLDVKDISAEEKKLLGEFLSSLGFTNSTFYLRFFQKGFSPWEIDGIEKCKEQFLDMKDVSEVLLGFEEDDAGKEHGDKGYLYTLAKSPEPGVFYGCLRKAKSCLCSKFQVYMLERGMCTRTVIKRFNIGDWKPWELKGIRVTLEEYLRWKEAKK